MGPKNNSFKQKREIQFETHNRKPGMAKFWKHVNHRRYRRQGTRINRDMAGNYNERS